MEKMNKEIMTYKDTKFINMLRSFGVKRLFKSLDFKLAIVLTIIFLLGISYFNVINQITGIFSTYATIDSAMIAIVIASLAIVVSISDTKFIKFISQDRKFYKNHLFLFWYGSVIAGISVVISISGVIITTINPNQTILNLLFLTLTTFLTSYAVFIVIMAIGSVMRFGLYRAEYTRITE